MFWVSLTSDDWVASMEDQSIHTGLGNAYVPNL